MKCLDPSTTNKSLLAEQQVVEFPRGLFGFEDVKRYRLVERPHETPFQWLEMLDGQGGSFLVARPAELIGSYEPRISVEDMMFLGIDSEAEVLVLAVVSKQNGSQATLNLKSPILINPKNGIGKQIIPRNVSNYTSQYPLEISPT